MHQDNELNRHRQSIAQLDYSILQLIKKRMDISSAIGKVKQKHTLNTEDLSQEQLILKRNLQLSSKLNLNKSLTQQLTKLLIKFSKNMQTTT